MKRLRLGETSSWLAELRKAGLEDPALGRQVADLIAEVRAGGDRALRALTRRFDGIEPPSIRLDDSELTRLAALCDPSLRRVLERAAENISAFHAPQIPRGYQLGGGRLRQRVVPLASVGLYIPGGRAAYPSTVLMTAIPARVAGVKRIAVATPPQTDGEIVSPAVAAACQVAGVSEVYLMGGAQAIAAFAFGTESVPRVDKICGPGSAWVAEAKRQVMGRVGIDMIAGPSELLIVDDGRGIPERMVYDLLAQAEHDPMATAICVTTSPTTWEKLPTLVSEVLLREPNPVALASMENRGAVIFADSIDDAIAFANELAPEHLELEADPALSERLTSAGAIFVGGFSPEAVGDYFAGPNHTLPTSGSARFCSALGVYDFVRRIHEIHWNEHDLSRHGADIARFARAEGLVAHARSIEVRMTPALATTHERGVDTAGYALESVRRQHAYTLKAPPDALVKLNQNEAPEDLPSEVKRALLAEFGALDWRRYPAFDPSGPGGLAAKIAARDGWDARGVLIGNGSNDLLTLLLRSVVGDGDTVVRVDPSFSLYPLHLNVAGARERIITLRQEDDFAFPVDEIVRSAAAAKVVLLASPNNPTGSLLEASTVDRLLAETSALVIVDEAYREWCGQDFAPLLRDDRPLVLLRTASKARAMAGLRFGYLLGPPSLCAELKKVALPYSVSSLTQCAASRLLDDEQQLSQRIALVTSERARLAESLRKKGRRVIAGGANFLLFSSADPPREFERLLATGVLVRDLSSSVPGFLRASIGTPAENDQLAASL